MNADNKYLDSLSEKVLGAVFEVSNTLGSGFLEKVYQRALLRELSLRGIRATTEASFTVIYKGLSVGEYFADLLVEDALVVELKYAERLANQRRPNVSTICEPLADGVPSGQFSEAQSRLEARRPWLYRSGLGNPALGLMSKTDLLSS
jgi:GxxExxY protein